LLSANIEHQAGNALRRRIAVEQIHRFPHLLKSLRQGIVVPQDHPVVEFPIDPILDETLDVAEIDDHVAPIQRLRTDLDLGDRVVAVRVFAQTVVVEQAMAVTKFDLWAEKG
jgi:hypothetical protein